MGNDWFHEYFINELKAIGRKPTSNMQHEVVDSLPSSGNEQTIYFVKNDSSSSNNHYDEYVWISSSSTFEKIGSTQIDGSTTQSDWNQNDDTQPDYVKNRICYVTLMKETVLPETEFTATVHNDYYDYYVANDNNHIFNNEFYNTIDNAEMADVIYDGVAYENVSISKEEAYVGSGSYMTFITIGKFNDTPFCIQIPEGYSESTIFLKTSGTHTISIVRGIGSYKKINGNYLDLCRSYGEFSEDLNNGNKIVSNKLLKEYGDFIDRKYKNIYIQVYFDRHENRLMCSDSYNNIISKLQNGADVFLTYSDQTYSLNAWLTTYLSFINISIDSTNDEYVIKSLKVSNEDSVYPVITEEESIRVSNNYLILNSSTEGSTKKFKIAIDDNGIIKIINTSDGTEVQLIQTDDHINELINTALNAIGIAEEGAY